MYTYISKYNLCTNWHKVIPSGLAKHTKELHTCQKFELKAFVWNHFCRRALRSACSRSDMITSASSSPTEILSIPLVTPASSSCLSLHIACVIRAGWHARL